VLVGSIGGRYEGEWKEGRRHGVGVRHWSDGGHYEGGWSEDYLHGEGLFCSKDGRRFQGSWTKREIKEGVLTEADGTCWRFRLRGPKGLDSLAASEFASKERMEGPVAPPPAVLAARAAAKDVRDTAAQRAPEVAQELAEHHREWLMLGSAMNVTWGAKETELKGKFFLHIVVMTTGGGREGKGSGEKIDAARCGREAS